MTGIVRRIFWDTETTGTHPEAGDRIVEIALVEADASLRKTGKFLHRYVNPEGRAVGETERIHGLSDAFLAAQRPFHAVVDEILDFVSGARMVAHNSEFDESFMSAELARLGREPTWDSTEDTLAMARKRYPGEPASLDSLIRRYGIDASKRTKHGALVDSELLIEVYAHMTGLTSLLPDHDPAAAVVCTGELMPPFARQSFPRRPVLLPDDVELTRHAALLSGMREPVWAAYAGLFVAANADAR